MSEADTNGSVQLDMATRLSLTLSAEPQRRKAKKKKSRCVTRQREATEAQQSLARRLLAMSSGFQWRQAAPSVTVERRRKMQATYL